MLTAAALVVLVNSGAEARPVDLRADVAAPGVAPDALADASVTQGSVTFANGSKSGFTAVAGLISVGATDGQDAAFDAADCKSAPAAARGSESGLPVARMSYVAYFAHGMDVGRRPILFLYDGAQAPLPAAC